jgi:2-octaprenyl-6-methoxyphenol hydroxylase
VVEDVVVVGGGIVGWAAALGLQARGFSVALIQGDLPASAGRTVALLGDTVSFIQELGIWSRLLPNLMPIHGLHIVDATASLFSMLPQSFCPEDIGREVFGYSVALEKMHHALQELGAFLSQSSSSHFSIYHRRAQSYDVSEEGVRLRLDDGSLLGARILIAADGAASLMRQCAGIDIQVWPYPQEALTMRVSHERDHKKNVVEYHMRSGPLNLLPVHPPEGAALTYPFSSHVVWVVSPEESASLLKKDPQSLAGLLEKQIDSLWGLMALESPIQKFPVKRLAARRLTASRIFLVGESAHQWSPLGAQGLNSGLSDVSTLVQILDNARREMVDLGHATLRKRYEKARKWDLSVRGEVIHGFTHALLASTAMERFVWDSMRGMGGVVLSAFPSLRRVLMRRTLTS